MTTSTRPDPWALEQLLGHRGPGRRLLRRRVGRHGLDEPLTEGRAVRVEVVEHDQPRAGACGTCQHAALKRRELLGPALVVHRVEAEVDDVGAPADGGGERRIGGVPSDDLRAGERAAAVAVDGDDVVRRGPRAARRGGGRPGRCRRRRGGSCAALLCANGAGGQEDGQHAGEQGDRHGAVRSEGGELLLDGDPAGRGDDPARWPRLRPGRPARRRPLARSDGEARGPVRDRRRLR